MTRTIPDDPLRVPDKRGTMKFARGGPNSRSTQLYFNLVDNTPRLDTLNGFGFPPIGRIVDSPRGKRISAAQVSAAGLHRSSTGNPQLALTQRVRRDPRTAFNRRTGQTFEDVRAKWTGSIHGST